MKSGKLLNFFAGYLTVYADGPFTERLINICMHRNMPVWDVKRCGSNRITFNISISAFRQIRTPAYRTKSHVRIMERHGLPFIIQKYRKRKLSLCAAVGIIFALWYASTHIMGITVFGNSRLQTVEILSALEECGVVLGAETSELEADRIRNKMMTEIEDLAWVGINANGSRVYVEIVERIEKEPGLEDDGTACNLIAKKDGEIERIEVREGQTVVMVGSGVRSGDVLVSGIMDNSVSGFRYVKSRGEVYAKTRYRKTRVYPLKFTEKVSTGAEKRRYTLSVMNVNIPLFLKSSAPYESFSHSENTQEYRIPVDIIPSLFVRTEIFSEEKTENRERTPNQAIEHGKAELTEELKKEISSDAEIIETVASHTLNEYGEVEVTVEMICRENIAEQAVIEKTIPELQE